MLKFRPKIKIINNLTNYVKNMLNYYLESLQINYLESFQIKTINTHYIKRTTLYIKRVEKNNPLY